MAMGHNLWPDFGVDEHSFATYFDVLQGYRVLTPQPYGVMQLLSILVALDIETDQSGLRRPAGSQGQVIAPSFANRGCGLTLP